jgi:hypothetical protein
MSSISDISMAITGFSVVVYYGASIPSLANGLLNMPATATSLEVDLRRLIRILFKCGRNPNDEPRPTKDVLSTSTDGLSGANMSRRPASSEKSDKAECGVPGDCIQPRSS